MNRCNRIDVNTINAWVTNYGSFFRNPTGGWEGFEWPKGGDKYAIYASGLWLGAKVNGEPRVAVAEYSYEFIPGNIDKDSHLPNDWEDPRFRVYKIKRGISDSWDYQNWPYEDGAPLDADGNPLFIGDQTLWRVYNDADTNAHFTMGSLPLGVEVQQTVFGDFRQSAYYDFLFIRWLIINKSIHNFDSVYVAIWSDPDLGDSGDDLLRCDSTLSLGYCYNGSNNDLQYGETPPAVGFQILQGPLVSSPSDSGIYLGYKRSGFQNLPMTAFFYHTSNNEKNGHPQTPQEVYYRWQALWRDGSRITYGGMGIDPNAPPTNFVYTGDPETGTGWLDSSPADRAFLMSTGPFNLVPGDSNEVVTAVIITRGNSHLNSVTELKRITSELKTAYDSNFYKLLRSYNEKPVSVELEHLILLHNYPNPFNVQTTISYELPVNRIVKLELYNIFGQRVATLVNERQEPGIYEVVWDAAGLPSGLYFANLRVAQYQLTKKLLLLK